MGVSHVQIDMESPDSFLINILLVIKNFHMFY